LWQLLEEETGRLVIIIIIIIIIVRRSYNLSTDSVNIQYVHAMLVIVQDHQSIFQSTQVQYLVPHQILHTANSSLPTSNYEQNTIFVDQVILHYTTNYSGRA
jgi:Tfp pilus assembly protein PilE